MGIKLSKKQRDDSIFSLIGWSELYEKQYFADMTFNIKSLSNEILSSQVLNHNASWMKHSDDAPYHLSISDFRFDVKNLGMNVLGICDLDDKTICISVDNLSSHRKLKETLLHEMIHAYEHKLRDTRYEYIFFIYLYEKLNKRLGSKKLKRLRSAFCHVLTTQIPGHSLLFWFKSVELDLRLRLPLGTIAAYGKSDDIKAFGIE